MIIIEKLILISIFIQSILGDFTSSNFVYKDPSITYKGYAYSSMVIGDKYLLSYVNAD